MIEGDAMGYMGYDPQGLASLRSRLVEAENDLRGLKCDDPDASEAIRVIAGSIQNLSSLWFPIVETLLESDPLSAYVPVGNFGGWNHSTDPLLALTCVQDWGSAPRSSVPWNFVGPLLPWQSRDGASATNVYVGPDFIGAVGPGAITDPSYWCLVGKPTGTTGPCGAPPSHAETNDPNGVRAIVDYFAEPGSWASNGSNAVDGLEDSVAPLVSVLRGRGKAKYVVDVAQYSQDMSALKDILPKDAGVFRARAGWVGGAFVVADVAFTAIDSWDDPPPGTPTVLRVGYTAAETAVVVGAGAWGAATGAEGGAAIGTAIFPGVGTVVGGVGGAIVGGFAAAFLADEATDAVFNAVWEES
jgi:hypothetical protein